jgi:hypothetical protein
MTDRVSCCVPFCKRSTKWDCSEFLCGKHWPAIDARLRKRKYRLFRRRKHLFGDNASWTYPAGSPHRIQCVRLDRICDKAWNACKKQAIERAVGI